MKHSAFTEKYNVPSCASPAASLVAITAMPKSFQNPSDMSVYSLICSDLPLRLGELTAQRDVRLAGPASLIRINQHGKNEMTDPTPTTDPAETSAAGDCSTAGKLLQLTSCASGETVLINTSAIAVVQHIGRGIEAYEAHTQIVLIDKRDMPYIFAVEESVEDIAALIGQRHLRS